MDIPIFWTTSRSPKSHPTNTWMFSGIMISNLERISPRRPRLQTGSATWYYEHSSLKTTLYIQLFNALIQPRLTYCSEVWRPFYRKDMCLLEKVRERFISRLACRTRHLSSIPAVPSVSELHQNLDEIALRSLMENNKLSHFLVFRPSNSRAGFVVSAIEQANSLFFDNLFPRRMANHIRSDPVLSSYFELSLLE